MSTIETGVSAIAYGEEGEVSEERKWCSLAVKVGSGVHTLPGWMSASLVPFALV